MSTYGLRAAEAREVTDQPASSNVELLRPGMQRWADSGHDETPAILTLVRRNLRLIAASMLLAGGAAMLVTKRITPTYEASASLRIDEKSSQLPALAALGLSGDNAVATELEMLRSRAIAEQVADSLALQLRVRNPIGLPRSAVFSAVAVARSVAPAQYRLLPTPNGQLLLVDRTSGARVGVLTPGRRFAAGGIALTATDTAGAHGAVEFDVQPFRSAVDTLQRRLSVTRRNRDTDVIDLQYRDVDREFARDVPNALAQQFIARRQEALHAEGRDAVRFLRQQVNRVSDQLADAERKLRAFREREGVVSLPDEASTGVARRAELQAERNALEAERSSLGKLLQASRETAGGAGATASSYRDLLAFPTLLRTGVAPALLAALNAAEERRTELLTRRTPQDPDVQLLSERIAQIQQQIQGLVGTYEQGLTGQVTALDGMLRSSDTKLQTIPRREMRLAELQRNAKGSEVVYSMLQSRLKEAEISVGLTDQSVQLVDPAITPQAPISPRPLRNVALGLLVGAAVGVSGAVARERINTSLRTRRDLLIASGVPVLGIVPRAGRTERRLLAPRTAVVSGEEHFSPVEEAYAHLATNLACLASDSPLRTLLVTSAVAGDGKTTVATNLALTLARAGKRVLLIDADMRAGRVAATLQIAAKPGLSELIGGQSNLVAPTRVSCGMGRELHVIPAGGAAKAPAPLLGSARTRQLLDWAKAKYEHVIIDTPPVIAVADAAIVASLTDGVIVIARAGVTERQAFALAIEQLHLARAPIAGAVLNDVDLRRDAAYDDAYRYYG